tara:strand:+ start:589 stop:744 length:156 start_codon:yes stop_codon:yes gene_type:complete
MAVILSIKDPALKSRRFHLMKHILGQKPDPSLTGAENKVNFPARFRFFGQI